MRAYRVASVFGVLVIVAGAISAVASPATAGARSATASTVPPGISLSRTAGPPTSLVWVSGAGFAGRERVDVFFDTTDLALARTGATGRFGPITISVPSGAVPDRHWISAKGRRSGRFAQTRFTVRTDWRQFHYSRGHTGWNPFENVLNASNVSQLQEDWSVSTGSAVVSSPAVARGVLYIGSGGHVYALNAATGAKLWSYRMSGGDIASSPAVVNGAVYVGSSYTYAVNAATGTKLWRLPISQSESRSPAVGHGVVYIGANGLHAVNAASGAKLWSVPSHHHFFDAPAVAHGVVYVGSGKELEARNAATGTMLWHFGPADPFGYSEPAVAGGVVYIGGFNGNVYAVNAATGAKLWSFATGAYSGGWRNAIFSCPAVANGVVYVSASDGDVYALNAATGKKLWIFHNFTNGIPTISSPVVANGVLYVGSEQGSVYALNDVTGKQLWSFTTGSYVVSSPTVANGVLYVGSEDGNVYAFHLPDAPAAPTRPSPANLHANHRLRAAS